MINSMRNLERALLVRKVLEAVIEYQKEEGLLTQESLDEVMEMLVDGLEQQERP